MSFQTILVDLQYVNLTLSIEDEPEAGVLIESDGYIEDISFSEDASILTWTMPRAALGSAIDQTLVATGYLNFGSFYLRLALFTLICGYYIRRRALQRICVGGSGVVNVAF